LEIFSLNSICIVFTIGSVQTYLFRVTSLVRVLLDRNLAERLLHLILCGLFGDIQEFVVLGVIDLLLLSSMPSHELLYYSLQYDSDYHILHHHHHHLRRGSHLYRLSFRKRMPFFTITWFSTFLFNIE
jgi:hypothetical protein